MSNANIHGLGDNNNENDNNNNDNEHDKELIPKKEIIFKFKTDKYEKELKIFTKNNLKETEIFKYSGNFSKKSELKDDFVMKWLSN